MQLRAAGPDDLAAITAVHHAYETAWFGAPEQDADEVREELELAESACVVEDGGRVIAVGNRWRTGSSIVTDPGGDAAAAAELLVPWLREVAAPDTEVLDRDHVLRARLEAAGWRHAYSSFDLLRPTSEDWPRGAPEWPDGVEVRRLVLGQESALHELIYARAGWAEVAGHHSRDLAEWQRLLLDGRRPEEAPVIAWRGDRPVGAVLLRLFSDGTGWISQLAVDRAERGQGLGRALLLDGLARLVAAGATKLGLGVIASNRTALRLYLSVGLRVDREWQTFAVDAQPAKLCERAVGTASPRARAE